MDNLPNFYVFGSPSSQDADILVLVDSIPKTHEAKILCKQYQDNYQPFFQKEVNANIGIQQNGQIIAVLKGSLDEVNNSILDTYSFHEQQYPLLINKRLERNVDLKILRGTRIILSNLSRTQHRSVIKEALRLDLIGRIDALMKINLSLPLCDTKNPLDEIYKTISFQLGQTLGLIEGKEFYTKESVCKEYPSLENFIMRKNNLNLELLESFKNNFSKEIKKRIPQMKNLIEPALNELN